MILGILWILIAIIGGGVSIGAARYEKKEIKGKEYSPKKSKILSAVKKFWEL